MVDTSIKVPGFVLKKFHVYDVIINKEKNVYYFLLNKETLYVSMKWSVYA